MNALFFLAVLIYNIDSTWKRRTALVAVFPFYLVFDMLISTPIAIMRNMSACWAKRAVVIR